MKENSVKVLNYVKENQGKNFTAADIAEALGMDVKSVNGIVTASFQRHKEVDEATGEKVIVPLMLREEAVIETEEGNKTVKFIRLTEAGAKFEPTID